MLLNPIIKGWTTYHRHIVAKKSFSKLGHEIHKILWQWSKRRHLNKSKHCIKNKYFKSIRGNTWSFTCNVQNIDRVSTTYELVNPAKLPIKRHIKTLSEANPYDRQWNNYFEKRLKHKMYESLSDNRKLSSIWNRQKGKCPNCKQPITLSTDWDI
ncbi:Uncharacterised protein [Orientia tsutsugamushi]|uniref:Group II intron maturase-specific domain-containing protein n=1 Tax=Orientia tsutsugamushi TaxID=784 RepID=A0A2R8F1I2_ORITS|nr:group II intron maturase-specific domain-containing protein [Orientia tsutsugamushi]SPM45255.1 Uncharacterised protein [Orientia tsutsugamushi]SPM46103.1 Uncharacterised protein [Orientia tsutsugamushi]